MYRLLYFFIKPFYSRNERTRNVAAGSSAMLIGKAISVPFNILIIGIISRHFSKVEFGLFAVLTSIITLTGSLDFGLGNGLRHRLATLTNESKECDGLAKKEFFATFYILSVFILLIILAFLFSSPFIHWGKIFNIKDMLIVQKARYGLSLIGILMLANLPMQLSSAGFFAYQMAYWKGLFDLLPNIFALVFVSLAIFLNLSFFQTVSSFFLAYTLAALVSIVTFIRVRQWSFIRISFRDQYLQIKGSVKLSMQFWLLGVLAAITINLGTWITSRVISLEVAGDFNLLQRMFFLIISFHLAAVTPFWSAFTQAQAAEDWFWAKSALKRLIFFSVGSVFFACILVILFYRPLIFWWAGRKLDNFPLVASMALWTILYALNSAYSMALNGFGMLRIPIILTAISAGATIPFNSLLGRQLGPAGIMLGQAVLLLPGTIIGPFLCYQKINYHLREKTKVKN